MMVIDPRRDVGIYLQIAAEQGMRLTGIFETHRNEDIVAGSKELSDLSGAPVYISKFEELGHTYGERIGEQDFPLGSWNLRSLHTPGHTRGHLSFVLEQEGSPHMVFSGDALFYGDLGRTDFYGEEALEEMTGMLYESIFEKLLPLGEQVLLYPAHGAGSACGGDIEERDVSTLGYEKCNNSALQVKNKEEFIEKHAYMRSFPPYFKTVEVLNVEPGAPLGEQVSPKVLSASKANGFDGRIIDIRSRWAFAGGHLPGSLFLKHDIISSHLGYLEKTDTPLALMADGMCKEQVELAYLTLLRMGYGDVQGVFEANLLRNLEISGRDIHALEHISPREYLENKEDYLVLDVRKDHEISEDDPVAERLCIVLSELPKKIGAIPKNRRILSVCQSAERATVASAYLAAHGISSIALRGGMVGLIAKKHEMG